MIQVYAPASIGNIGVGFDVLGMAIKPINSSLLGDLITIEDSDIFNIKNIGLFHNQLPNRLEQNIVFQCCKTFCEILGKTNLPSVTITLEKNVPVSSGLGSSACSIVATLIAMNCYYKYPFDNNRLLMLMGEMEGKISGSMHFDNVSPCFLGGVRLILPKNKSISQLIPMFNNWIWIIAYPGIKIATITSRSVLPKQYDREDCINHSKYLSGFIHACHTKQEYLAIKCIQDIIAEPYRSKLLPMDLSYIRNIMIKKGALSCGISGAGPTIFILCNTMDIVNDLVDWLLHFYLKNDLGFVEVCSLNNFGAHIIME